MGYIPIPPPGCYLGPSLFERIVFGAFLTFMGSFSLLIVGLVIFAWLQ